MPRTVPDCPRLRIAGLLLVLMTLAPASALAADPETTAPVVVNLEESLDLWRNTWGGAGVGDTALNKLQVTVDVEGPAFGAPGWTASLQVFRTDGGSLSDALAGDLQTASNIEAPSGDRLMEAWAERRIGDQGSFRFGLMDLNAEFDSIEPAGLFLNSSHGIAPDLSQSGLNGPSIFPVSALGARAEWSPSDAVSLRAAVFDGVPGDLDRPDAFVAIELSRRDGALLIAQADWAFAEWVQASVGAWRYTAAFERLDRPGARQQGQGGVYAFVEGDLPGATGWSGWLRVGVADADVAVIADYVGLGVVRSAPFRGRPDDQLGFAVARAGLGGPARRPDGLPAAETVFELTYRLQVSERFAIQPDLQYVRHPASRADLNDALIVGLRLSVSLSGRLGDAGPPDRPLRRRR